MGEEWGMSDEQILAFMDSVSATADRTRGTNTALNLLMDFMETQAVLLNTHVNETRQWRYETRAAATVGFIQLFIVLAYMITYAIILIARHVTKRQEAQLEANLLEMEERLAQRKRTARRKAARPGPQEQ